jgi:phosphatidylserine/phosphatidylglycerophosphate/cardiolipin synthase-like enzyme
LKTLEHFQPKNPAHLHKQVTHFFSVLKLNISNLGIALLLAALGAHASAFQVPAAGSIEVAFSPNEGSEDLVIKAIDSAQKEILGLAYSFTSAPITQAVLRAKKRGVRVTWVVDAKSNTQEDRSGKAQAALSALVNAGCEIRLISVYPIHHDKTIIIDEQTVELGSFNFSQAAAKRNSEDVLVNWNNPALAKVYLQHFDRNYKQSRPFQAR